MTFPCHRLPREGSEVASRQRSGGAWRSLSRPAEVSSPALSSQLIQTVTDLDHHGRALPACGERSLPTCGKPRGGWCCACRNATWAGFAKPVGGVAKERDGHSMERHKLDRSNGGSVDDSHQDPADTIDESDEGQDELVATAATVGVVGLGVRSEERRVGKEGGCGRGQGEGRRDVGEARGDV